MNEKDHTQQENAAPELIRIDASWDNDRFLITGRKVSMDAYYDALNELREGKTKDLSTFTLEDTTHYGLTLTWEEAQTALSEMQDDPQSAPGAAAADGVYGLTTDKLATRKGPGTTYEGGGTYSVKGQYIKVLSKAWDKRNGIWWVKCEIPYRKEIRVLWTGWKRFDPSTISLEDLPEETWD